MDVIMNTKLTLRMDDSLIESVKRYSSESGKSVSQIVADYFTVIQNEKLHDNDALTPNVRALKGVLSNPHVDLDAYHHYLEEKYL